MNRRWLAGALAAALICCGCPGRAAAGEEACPAVYLRVVARNDSPEAQAEKRRVRDAVLAACPARCDDPGALLPAVRRAAASIAPCRTDIRPWTPGGGVPSAATVYIVLGEGNGRNWWGVLYKNALLWARLEDGAAERHEPDGDAEAAPSEPHGTEPAPPDRPGPPEPPRQPAFVWPFRAWLRGLLGL